MLFKQAFVLLTNKHSYEVINLYETLLNATKTLGETFIVYHHTTAAIPDEIRKTRYHAFTNDILTNLNYKPIANRLIPGSCHFPLLDFYLQHPHFDYYWFTEDDVTFNGSWKHLFDLYSNNMSDFIACHIRTHSEEPNWHWWDSLSHPDKFIPKKLRLRCFNPFFRISNAALNFIHYAQTNNWQGHNEVLFPTLLFLEGYQINDFGGNGQFVLKDMENKIYVDAHAGINGYLASGTMRYRPPITDQELIFNKLHHPFKYRSI